MHIISQGGDKQYFFKRHGIGFIMPNPEPYYMDSKLLEMLLKEREMVANELQNEINQSLASVLLWIQCAVKENELYGDPSLQQAETNLRETIERSRALHYSITKNLREYEQLINIQTLEKSGNKI